MTLTEKQEKIHEFHGKHAAEWHTCKGCPLYDTAIKEPCWEDLAFVEKHYNMIFGETPTTAEINPYWERICSLSEKQRAKGMETYGQGLESNPAAILERINHLEEELIDGLMYCEWIKDKIFELEDKANGDLSEQN